MLSRAKKVSIVLGIAYGFVFVVGFLSPGGVSLRLAAAAALFPLILVPFILPRRVPPREEHPPVQPETKTEPASTTSHAMGGNYA